MAPRAALRLAAMLLLCTAAAGLTATGAIKTLNNFRSLGAIPCRGNTRIIRPGLLYRAASPAKVSEPDALELQRRVRTIIDLRSENDARQDSGARLLAPRTTHVELLKRSVVSKRVKRLMLRQPLHAMPFLLFIFLRKLLPPLVADMHQRITSLIHRKLSVFIQSIELADVYFWILVHHGESLRQVILTCAEESAQPVLVHCTHGKDRTGVLVALLLHICGVSEETIAKEYALSDSWGCSVEGRAEMLRAMPPKLQEALDGCAQFDAWCGAPESTMRELWRRVARRYGSMDRYLDSIGINASTRERISAALTMPVAESPPHLTSYPA
ncbi:hypothetical protein AB1Y20_010258 [Prymnesium parvum]|uniref:Tyrosine specific protein phosphatases domain-containing protein n=1 Tax=Prymnesium parvum TaxID=97485 RepID=A0AB34K3Y3_PRYPA